MPVTVAGTTITFNDGTVQTTAAVGNSREFDGVGSYVVAHLTENPGFGSYNQTSFRVRGYIAAGSNLRLNSRATGNVYGIGVGTETGWGGPFNVMNGVANNTFPSTNTTTLSGTWRLMTAGAFARSNPGNYGWESTSWFPMLWVRIS